MAAVNDLEMENKQLKNHIEDLVKELEEKENQVVLSAQLGKELLESNNELNRQLEEMQESCLMRVEDLCQENYSLKMKIEGNVYTRENFTSEMENMKEKLHEEASQELCRVTGSHEKRINELQVEIESLHNELEKGTLVTEQLQEKIAKQEQMLAEAHKYSKKLEGMSILESQLEELKEECTLMRFKNDETKITLTDVIDEKEQLLFDQQNLMQRINSLNENLEEKTNQGKIWFDALQDLRQEASEFQMEISVLKAELLNKSHKEKGNSLFGEVEDKRLALEQKYSTVSTKYESLQKIHQIVKRQLHQLKTQILPMLQMATNKADSSKIKRLEAALSKSRNEVQRFNVKMKELQNANNERELGSRLEEFHEAFKDFNKEDKDYVAFLQTEIRCLKKTMEELRSENEITTVKLIAETDKRRETESLLHASEVKKEKLEHDVVRLRLRVDELKIKLQQDLKNTEQIEGCSNDREPRHSIWNDASLFTKRKKTQAEEKPKEIGWEKPPSVEQPENRTHESQLLPEACRDASTVQEKINKTVAIQPTAKAKPVGRVLPLNESSNSSDGLKANKKVISDEEKQHGGESMRTPLTESNNTSVSLDHSAADSMLEAVIKPSRDDQIPSDHGNTENVSISRESTIAKVRRQEPQKRRVIHVKKDAGLKNECNQQ